MSVKIPPRGLEPLSGNSKALDNKELTANQIAVLASCLAQILQKHPDLASLIEQLTKHWTDIPEPGRKQIITTARTAINPGGPSK
jgi:hypothetical protein